MLLLLFSLENCQQNVGVLLVHRKFLLDLRKEFDHNVNVFVGLQLALHWRNCKDLFGALFLHLEVVADRILPLILEIERQFFGFSHTHISKVQIRLHLLI